MKFRLGRLFFSFEPNRAIIGCLPVGAVCDCENVRRNFDALLALIQLDDLLGVDGQPLVRVHHHAEEARVGVDQLTDVPKGKLHIRSPKATWP